MTYMCTHKSHKAVTHHQPMPTWVWYGSKIVSRVHQEPIDQKLAQGRELAVCHWFPVCCGPYTHGLCRQLSTAVSANFPLCWFVYTHARVSFVCVCVCVCRFIGVCINEGQVHALVEVSVSRVMSRWKLLWYYSMSLNHLAWHRAVTHVVDWQVGCLCSEVVDRYTTY